MRLEKEKHKVIIALRDNILLKGYVYINPGERILDFINDVRESFIAVTDVELLNAKDMDLFIVKYGWDKKKDCLIVIKSAILWIEEVQ